MRTLRHALVGAASGLMYVLMAGCSLLGSETTISLELPGVPKHWPQSVKVEEYRVVWRGAAGKLREITVAGGARRVEVSIPKRPGLAVLAYPSFAGGAFLPRPAAAIFPHDSSGNTRGNASLQATYERGFTGLVLHRALFALPSLNSGRLIEEVRVRSHGNPWIFDLERVVEKLAWGRFSTIYLRPRDVFEIEVTVEADTATGDHAGTGDSSDSRRWLRDNSLVDVLTPMDSPEGPVLQMELPPGHHHLMQVEGGEILSIVVEDEGSYRVFRR